MVIILSRIEGNLFDDEPGLRPDFRKEPKQREDILRIVIIFVFLVLFVAAAISFLNWDDINEQQEEREHCLAATGHPHSEEDQTFSATDSHEED